MQGGDREVVIYTSVDQVFSEPILNGFEKAKGIKVKAVYDVEASKTAGLVNRLIAEKDRPKCDVFWNIRDCPNDCPQKEGCSGALPFPIGGRHSPELQRQGGLLDRHIPLGPGC